MKIGIRDSVADAKRRKRAKRRARQDPEYLAWVHQWPCAVGRECWGRIEFHHDPPKSHAGEWSDRDGLMLCQRHHDRAISGSRHALGLELFEQEWKINIRSKSAELNAAYEEERSTK